MLLYLSVYSVMLFDSLMIFTISSPVEVQVSLSVLMNISLCGLIVMITGYFQNRWSFSAFPRALLFFRAAAVSIAGLYSMYTLVLLIVHPRYDFSQPNFMFILLYMSVYFILVLAVLYTFLIIRKAVPQTDTDVREFRIWKRFTVYGLMLLPFLTLFHWLYALIPFIYTRVPYETGILFQQAFYLVFMYTSYNHVRNLQVIPSNAPFGLTKREYEVARCLALGLSYQSIADELFVSLSTVQTHVRNVYYKTGCNNKTRLAVRLGAIEEEDR